MFLSTPPSRVATAHRTHRHIYPRLFLSTPPSRVATGGAHRDGAGSFCFYPRHPRGWRHTTINEKNETVTFLSTPPSRVATSDNVKGIPLVARFYPRHPRGWRRIARQITFHPFRFYPRHPRGWRPPTSEAAFGARTVSIHATLAGGDLCPDAPPEGFAVSIHATLAGGDLWASAMTPPQPAFLSTPPSRVATFLSVYRHFNGIVSIHATLAGGDFKIGPFMALFRCFYPRHPRGWRHLFCSPLRYDLKFLSTPPSRVATSNNFISIPLVSRFYPRHPREWRQSLSVWFVAFKRFYPRHPREWRLLYAVDKLRLLMFLSTPPSRVATLLVGAADFSRHVSIHATLASGDPAGLCAPAWRWCFYPRHPREWRQSLAPHSNRLFKFLSTPPSRVATSQRQQMKTTQEFLSTPPSRVATWRGRCCWLCDRFLSTPPSRVATKYGKLPQKEIVVFLSTPPSRVATVHVGMFRRLCFVSIHATLAGGDTFP